MQTTGRSIASLSVHA